MASDYRPVLAALHDSHDRLASLVQSFSPEQLRAPSYCSDWTIAQALSHIGSGAEIGLMLFRHALAGEALPGRESFQPIWDKWNARSPEEVAANVLDADAAHLRALDEAPVAALEAFSMDFFGRSLDAAGLMAMRLSEHALHTWDVEVVGDQGATLNPVAVAQLVDRTPLNAGRYARGARPSFRGELLIATTAPSRRFVLDLSGEEIESRAGEQAGEPAVELPAEALLRLLSGRLDDAHTPSSVKLTGPVGLTELRGLFSGF